MDNREYAIITDLIPWREVAHWTSILNKVKMLWGWNYFRQNQYVKKNFLIYIAWEKTVFVEDVSLKMLTHLLIYSAPKYKKVPSLCLSVRDSCRLAPDVILWQLIIGSFFWNFLFTGLIGLYWVLSTSLPSHRSVRPLLTTTLPYYDDGNSMFPFVCKF
jgi:hypothetical protein